VLDWPQEFTTPIEEITMSELVFIRAYGNRFEAEQAQQYLETLGIDAMVQADDVGGMYAGLSLGKKGVRLLVRDEDALRAREALEPGEVLDAVAADALGGGPESTPAPLVAAERAAAFFDADNNCAEAVLRTFAEDLEIEATVVPLATGFGGGMGRDGDVCGALSGAIMVLGLRFGRLEGDDREAKELCYEKVRLLRARFREACGALNCRDLVGVDLRTDEGRQKMQDEGLDISVCRRCVREVAHIAAELLAE
jgi:C_GCAxxG_C_C family probable redox protein